ncbi:MAG: hypothetical protein ACR2M3_16090 [Thermomicrobiales bacterium]
MGQLFDNTPRNRAITIGTVFLGITLVASITAFAATNVVTDSPTPRPATSYPYSLLPSGATLDPPHQRIFDTMATEHAEKVIHATQFPVSRTFSPPPTFTPAPMATPVQTPYVSLGIQPGYESSPYNKGVQIANHWDGYINGQFVEVFAGKSSDTAKEGFVGVSKGKVGEPYKDVTTVSTPTQHGGVKITAVNMYLFTLVAEDGTIFTFDLQTLAFK